MFQMESMNLNDFQKKVLKEASSTSGYGGFAVKSSIRHMERSVLLRESMPEIAAFVAITAEEESATAIFTALKKRRYTNANKLKSWDHKHKSGISPFFDLIGGALGILKNEIPLELFFDSLNGNKKEKLWVRMPIGEDGDKKICIVPQPPLNLVSVDPNGKATDYLLKVREIASDRGIDSIFKYIQEIANERNKMLYASNSSVSKVTNIDDVLTKHLSSAYRNHLIYLLIDQHAHQNLVQEALDAFLIILKRIDEKET